MGQVKRILPRALVYLKRLCLLLPLLCLGLPLHAASPPAADQPAKIRELLDLLGDPQIQDWIKAQQAAKTAEPAADTQAKAPDLLASPPSATISAPWPP
jgi:hypothetical protein